MGKNIVLLLLVFVVFGFVGYYSYQELLFKQSSVLLNGNQKSLSTKLMAVDLNGNGLLIDLTVEIKPGDGKILANIDVPSFITDTQASMREAARQAAVFAKTDISNLDVVYSVTGPVNTIGGPSAGAAMTVATAALLLNKPLRQDALITGTIEDDGTIGPVGGIREKLEAAKTAGYKIVLIPQGESIAIEPVRKCEQKPLPDGGFKRECTVSYSKINLTESIGISVIEVRSVEEAFFKLTG